MRAGRTAADGGVPGGAEAVACPLCGAAVPAGGAACGACPVSPGCGTICCTRCGYRFVERSAIADWIVHVWRRVRAGRGPGAVGGANARRT